jgi:copper(I)-binding protein
MASDQQSQHKVTNIYSKGIIMKKVTSMTLIALYFCTTAQAQVNVKEVWVRATVPQQKVTGAFMQIQSAQDARLIEVRSPAAAIVELHEMKMEGGVMRMRPLNGLDLPAGKTIELKPGSYHIMLTDLKAQVKVGDVVPLTLIIEDKSKKRETIELNASVKALNQTPARTGAHH